MEVYLLVFGAVSKGSQHVFPPSCPALLSSGKVMLSGWKLDKEDEGSQPRPQGCV